MGFIHCYRYFYFVFQFSIFKSDISVNLEKWLSLFVINVISFSMATPAMSKSMFSMMFPVRFSFPYSSAEMPTDSSVSGIMAFCDMNTS